MTTRRSPVCSRSLLLPRVVPVVLRPVQVLRAFRAGALVPVVLLVELSPLVLLVVRALVVRPDVAVARVVSVDLVAAVLLRTHLRI
jgi:hypothetical protein